MAIPPSHIILGFALTSIAYFVLNSVFRAIQRRRLIVEKGCLPPKITTGRLDFGIHNYKTVIKHIKEFTIFDYIKEEYLKYGNTHNRIILGSTTIVTAEPENVKAVLATQFNDFSLGNRHTSFGPFLGEGIFTLDGAGWSHSRAMLRPQFSREQIADVAMLGDHVDQLISLIPTDGTPFDIQEKFFNLTLDSATEFLFGESTNTLLENRTHTTSDALASIGGEEGLAQAFNRSQDHVLDRIMTQGYSWLIDSKKAHKDYKLVHEVVDYYVDRALERYNNAGAIDQEKVIEGSTPSGRYVFLDAMVRVTQDKKTLRDQMLNILLAGRDTTASLLSSSFFYLCRHPQAWNRLRDEIISVFPPTEPVDSITIAGLREVKYLRHVLNEALRLIPPVSSNSRWAKHDTTLPVGGGPDGKSPIFVRKDQKILYEVVHMHRRADLWGNDADEFRPERWEERASHGWEFLPFNGGPRICLGQQYALTEASYVLVRLLQKFDRVENAQPEIITPKVKTNLVTSHAHGVKIGLFASEK